VTDSEFSLEIRRASWRLFAAIIAPAALVGISLFVTDPDPYGLLTLGIVLVILAFVFRFSTRGRKVSVSLETNGMRFATRKRKVIIPWSATEQVRALETRGMPFSWRVTARLWGYDPSERWVEMRAKGMLRATWKSVKATGIGFPLFLRLIYIRPDRPTIFVAAVDSHLSGTPPTAHS